VVIGFQIFAWAPKKNNKILLKTPGGDFKVLRVFKVFFENFEGYSADMCTKNFC
jgi:hypothetical protein